MRKRLPLQAMLEVAIFAGFAMLLDLLPKISPIPSISISLTMVPIFIVAFRWGFKASFISGLIWGILQIITGDAWILTPLQAFIEYFIAFAFIGFAGLFARFVQNAAESNQKFKMSLYIIIGTFVGSLARYFWHFIAGVVFFSHYAEEAGQTAIFFSFVTNGITMLSNFIGCSIVIVLLLMIQPNLLKMYKRQTSWKRAS